MKMILMSELARILDIKYRTVKYHCRKYHIIGQIKLGKRNYYYIEYAKCVAESLINLSDKTLDEVIEELDQY